MQINSRAKDITNSKLAVRICKLPSYNNTLSKLRELCNNTEIRCYK